MDTLQTIMKGLGVRQKALADHLGVSEPTLSRWATRETDIPARQIGPIAAFLGLPPADILAVAVSAGATQQREIAE